MIMIIIIIIIIITSLYVMLSLYNTTQYSVMCPVHIQILISKNSSWFAAMTTEETNYQCTVGWRTLMTRNDRCTLKQVITMRHQDEC